MPFTMDFGPGTELDTWFSVLGNWYGDFTIESEIDPETGLAEDDREFWGRIAGHGTDTGLRFEVGDLDSEDPYAVAYVLNNIDPDRIKRFVVS